MSKWILRADLQSRFPQLMRFLVARFPEAAEEEMTSPLFPAAEDPTPKLSRSNVSGAVILNLNGYTDLPPSTRGSYPKVGTSRGS